MSASIDTRQQLQPQPLTIPARFGGLTLKQSAFIDHYLLTGNATDAAVKAGYSQDRNVAAVTGSQSLRNPKIQNEIKRRLGISICSSSEVLEILSKHARADLTDLLDKDGKLVFSKAKAKRLLKKLKTKTRTDKDGNVTIEHEYEIHDPQVALEKLGRFHKLFVDRVEETSISINIDVQVRQEMSQAISTIVHSTNCTHAEAVSLLREQCVDTPALLSELDALAVESSGE